MHLYVDWCCEILAACVPGSLRTSYESSVNRVLTSTSTTRSCAVTSLTCSTRKVWYYRSLICYLLGCNQYLFFALNRLVYKKVERTTVCVLLLVAQLERQLQQTASLRQDNDSLRQSVQDYKTRLQQCQVTIGESRAELRRLEQQVAGGAKRHQQVRVKNVM